MTARQRKDWRDAFLALLAWVLAGGLALYAVVHTESVQACLQ